MVLKITFQGNIKIFLNNNEKNIPKILKNYPLVTLLHLLYFVRFFFFFECVSNRETKFTEKQNTQLQPMLKVITKSLQKFTHFKSHRHLLQNTRKPLRCIRAENILYKRLYILKFNNF